MGFGYLQKIKTKKGVFESGLLKKL